MANNLPHTHRQGFTLIETLVALGVTAILLATLIPISRTTLFRIVTLGEEHDLLSAFEHAKRDADFAPRSGQSQYDGITTKIEKRPLPPFRYEDETATRWQPVLVTIEARTAKGTLMRSEFIRLERETQ